MLTVRLSVVGTVILVLLGSAVVAQDEGSLDPMRASHFTGTWSEQLSGVGPDQFEWTSGPGYGESLGNESVGVFDATDPRISGTWTQVNNLRAFPIDPAADDHATAWTGAVRIESEDGTWVGTIDGYHNGTLAREWNLLTGEGTYEGLTAIFRWIEEGDAYEGVIIPGVPPDYPGLIAASSEGTGEPGAREPAAWTEATVEVLSDVGVIPLEAIPDDADHVTYARISVEPGISGGGPGNYPQSWSNLEYVSSGTLSATPETNRVFWRADGSVEESPSGSTAEMRVGDTVLSWNGGAAGQWENSGPEEWVSFFVGAGNSHEPDVEPVVIPGVEWRHLDYIFPPQATVEDWFSAPIAVSYEQITWEPGAQLALGPGEVPMLSFIWLESGKLRFDQVVVDQVDQADLDWTLLQETTWRGQTPDDGTVHVLRNEGDEPAVAMGVTLSHDSGT